MAMVLFNTYIMKIDETPPIWKRISNDDRETFKRKSLELLGKKDMESALELVEAIGQAEIDIHKATNKDATIFSVWPEARVAIAQMINSGNHVLHANALEMFGLAPFSFIHIKNWGDIKQLLSNGVNPKQELQVRLAGLGAMARLFEDMRAKNQLSKHDMDAYVDHFKSDALSIITLIVDVCQADSGEFEQLRDVLENVSTLVEYGVEPFMPCIKELFTTSVQIATHRQLVPNCRRMAVEIIAQLCDTKAKELTPLLGSVVPVLLEFVCTEDDNMEEWLNIDENEEGAEADSDHVIGWQTLDRVARGLGGEELLAILFSQMYLPAMLSSTDWRQRRGALVVIYAVAEGCKEQMEEQLGEITLMVVRNVEDSDPRVRRAALQAAGQLAVDFAGDLQNAHHEVVMKGLMYTIEHERVERVIISALTAVTLFFKPPNKPETHGTILDKYTDPVMKALCGLLKCGVSRTDAPKVIESKQDARLREQVIQTISVIADLAKKTFETYFDELMPVAVGLLINLQANPNANQFFEKQALQRFRGKTFECVTMMGEAVGKVKFEPHREEVLRLLQHFTPQNMENSDDQHAVYILMAWFRIAVIIGGEAFFQGGYMHLVITPLLTAAEISPNIKTITDDEEDEEGYEYIPYRKNIRLAVQTSVLQDKEQACKVLMMYAQSLKQNFHEWVPRVATAMIANVGYTLDPNVSIAACYNLPELLKACNHHMQDKIELWYQIFAKLMKTLNEFDMKQMEDVENEDYCLALQATIWVLFVCLEEMKDHGLSDRHGVADQSKLEQLDAMIMKHIDMYEKRASVRKSRRLDLDPESELARELDELEERDNILLQYLAYVVTAMFACGEEAQMEQFFFKRRALFERWIKPKQMEYERYFAITGFGEYVRVIGERSLTPDTYQTFVMPIIDGIMDESSDVRFISCFYVGLFAENGGPRYRDVVLTNGLPKLKETVVTLAAQRAKDEAKGQFEDNEYRVASDAAVVALKRIHKVESDNQTSDAAFLQNLVELMVLGCPLEPETEEVGQIYQYLSSLVTSNQISSEECLRKLLGAFYVAITSDMTEEENENAVKMEIWVAIHILHQRFPKEVILQLIDEMRLDSRQRATLSEIDQTQGACLAA